MRQALHDADGIVIRSGTQLTADVLAGPAAAQGDRPRRASASTTSTSPAATRQGIVVMNTPGGNTVSTAEHTMALMLALARNVAQANDSLKAGKWDRNKFTGTQLEGKTLGVDRPGPGRAWPSPSGRWAFGMTVLGFDPFLSAEKAARARHRERLAARRPLGPVRLHHAAHAAHRRDPQPDRRPRARP